MSRRERIKAWFTDDYGLTDRGFAVVAIGSLLALLVVTVVIVGAVTFHVERVSCEHTEQQMGRDTRYEFWGAGCYVRIADGTYVPLDTYRLSDVEGES